MDSLDFCKGRVAASPSLQDRKFDDVMVRNSEWLASEVLGEHRQYTVTGTNEDGNSVERHILLEFKQDADWEYCTCETCYHDGTLMFIDEAAYRCLLNVISGDTYRVNKRPPIGKCNVKYTIGDIIEINEYDLEHKKFAEGCKTMRTTVMIPLIYECDEIIDGEETKQSECKREPTVRCIP